MPGGGRAAPAPLARGMLSPSGGEPAARGPRQQGRPRRPAPREAPPGPKGDAGGRPRRRVGWGRPSARGLPGNRRHTFVRNATHWAAAQHVRPGAGRRGGEWRPADTARRRLGGQGIAPRGTTCTGRGRGRGTPVAPARRRDGRSGMRRPGPFPPLRAAEPVLSGRRPPRGSGPPQPSYMPRPGRAGCPPPPHPQRISPGGGARPERSCRARCPHALAPAAGGTGPEGGARSRTLSGP